MPVFRLALLACVSMVGATPLMAMGGGGSSPSASAPQYDVAQEYQKGVAALQAGNYKAAKTAFDHVLPSAPKDANTNYLAGLARAGLGDWKGARKLLEKAVNLDANLIAAQAELGVTYVKLGDRPKAEATLGALQGKAASCAGTCAQAADLKAAIDAVQAALGGAPQARIGSDRSLLFASAGTGDSAYLEAVSLINEKRYAEAIASLKIAQQAFGPHPDILTYLGFANRQLKRYDVAEGYYRAALAAAPGHKGATEYFGELMVERGDMAGARMMLARLDASCHFGCAEAEELRGWIAAGRSPHS